MKIGIISDIHGNIDALNSVLKMLEKEEVDKILKELKPTKILEIGTAVGYSAICLSEYLIENGIIEITDVDLEY